MTFVPVGQVDDAMAAVTMRSVPARWVVLTRGDPHSYIAAVTEALRAASGGFAVGNVRTMEDVNGLSMALFLASIGIYGLMAYSVAQRMQEMGIRMALGADASSIRNLVVWQGMRLTLMGVTAGLLAAFGLSRFIATFLFGVKVWDPVAFLLCRFC
jgi:hypothetical protein